MKTPPLQRYISGSLAIRQKIVEQIFADMRSRSSEYWMRRIPGAVVRVSALARKLVPAYKAHLTKQRAGKTLASIPEISKKDYLRVHPYQKLSVSGVLAGGPRIFTATSGSTGEPFYFPRDLSLDIESSITHEAFLRNAGIRKEDSTLVVVGFGMGVWIGGIITYEAFKTIAERGYNISIITTGSNKHEIFAALKNLGKHYDHIVLCGYPPFIKDVIEEGPAVGIRWKSFPSLKLVFAAETFTERFREYVAEKAGVSDIYHDTMNIYGSAELGTMASETPFSIMVRRLALENRALFERLFSDAGRIPTFVQFNPDFIAFEAKDRHILCTAATALPLVRYAIGDNGGVLSYEQVATALAAEGYDLEKEMRKRKITGAVTKLPFVYVYERSDLSTKLYGAIIYPEHIREALLNAELLKHLTGRFTISTEYDRRLSEVLEVNLELRRGERSHSRLLKKVSEEIIASMRERNAEYAYLYQHMPERVLPKLKFWPYEHPKYFKQGIKQRWVKKR